MSFDLSQLANSAFWNIRIKEIQLKAGGNQSNYFTCTLDLDNYSASNIYETCQCVVGILNGTFYIQILSLSKRADSSRLSHRDLHQLNKKEIFGRIKIKKEDNLIFIYHYFSAGFVNEKSHEKFLIHSIEKLFNAYIKTLNHIEDLEFFCEKCPRLISECICDEEFEVYEKNVEVFDGMMKYKDSEIFDFNEIYYSNNKYRLNPGDSLENYLRSGLDQSEIQNLLKKSGELELKMRLQSLYLKRYPVNLILCIRKNSLIEALIIAPSFKSKSHFSKYFSRTHESSIDLQSEISKRLDSYQTQNRPLIRDYFDPQHLNLLNREKLQSSIPGFYEVSKYSTNNNSTVKMVHLPLNPCPTSTHRVEQEYRKGKLFESIKTCLKPSKLIKIDSRTGIIYDYSSSLSSSLTDLSLEEKIKTMKKVAEIINLVHSKKIFLSSLHPDNIVFHKNEVKLKDFSHSTDTPDLDTYDKDHLVFMDPLVLESKKNSFQSDVWSWAMVFIGLFTNFDPYQDSSYSLNPGGLNLEIKPRIEEIYHEVYTMNKKPRLDLLPDNTNLRNLLKACLDLNPQARPSIQQIIAKLHTI